MLPVMLRLAAAPRLAASALDRAAGADTCRKRLVEVLREQFQKLHRERHRRDGALVLCCELLRLYFCLEQAAQCSFLLAAVGQHQVDPDTLPKALAVPLYYFWGKFCVLEGNVLEGEERLSWALAQCPPGAQRVRERILSYLMPCRLRAGRFPSKDFVRRHRLESYAGLISAASLGDVRRFDQELEANEMQLVRAGTYLVVEKLRLLAYRNLCRQVYELVAADLEAAGKAVDQLHKQDFGPYETAFQWQDDCDADETVCVLANLIFVGAIRGYMSDEHHKIVFSKEAPFPPVASWCPKA